MSAKRAVIVECSPVVADDMEYDGCPRLPEGVRYDGREDLFERHNVTLVRLVSAQFPETPAGGFYPRVALIRNPDGTYGVEVPGDA
jgi:hypothetical protein